MTDRRLRRWAAAIATVILTGATLSACVGIPNSGAVSEGKSISDSTVSRDIEIRPQGPVRGANQQAIVSGFIAAFSGAADNYYVAREYLTTKMASSWDPRASVLIRTDSPKLASYDAKTIDYTFDSDAQVDASGAYKQLAGEAQNLRFQLVQVKGEWRISDAPDGIVLSDATFHSIFREYPLQFLDLASTHFVPDLRWFANGTASGRIVNALLAGPPPWLQRAVRTAFPDGTKLTPGTLVNIAAGVATVDLTAEVKSATTKERQLMQAQLYASLSGVPSISKVTILAAGEPLPIPDPDSTSDLPQPGQTAVDASALVVRDKEFGYLSNSGTRVSQIGNLSQRVAPLNPTGATLSSDGRSVAVLGDGGVSLVRTDGVVALDRRQNLIAPTMDESGYVWTVQNSDPNSIQVWDAAGVAHPLVTTLESDARIVSLQVSRDGARVAVLLDTDSGARLVVAAIIRDPDKLLPTALGQPILDTTVDRGEAIDASWYDGLSVATLIRTNGSPVVQVYEVGGGISSLGRPGDSVAIVGGNGREGLRVLGSDATLRAYRGSSWQSAASKISLIATQRASSR
jgi:hypothetical protein